MNRVQPDQKRAQPRALVPVDDVAGNLPFIVRRDHRIVAAFAKKAAAEDWAQMRSFNDESRFTVHTASEVLFAFQAGCSAADEGARQYSPGPLYIREDPASVYREVRQTATRD